MAQESVEKLEDLIDELRAYEITYQDGDPEDPAYRRFVEGYMEGHINGLLLSVLVLSGTSVSDAMDEIKTRIAIRKQARLSGD